MCRVNRTLATVCHQVAQSDYVQRNIGALLHAAGKEKRIKIPGFPDLQQARVDK